jgi:hypothetical protein|tara:strand:- start:59 stop:232 length:174 start_codon:yes stop_codon:yes gene_type:complete
MKTKLDEYLESTDFVGMDNVLSLQRRIDGAVAAKFGITSLGPTGFILGLLAGYVFFA